jgi:ABC-type transport system involved in multi-copper enzyme maturation permease subunit
LPAIAASLVLAIVVVAGLASLYSARQPDTVALDVGLSFVRFALALVAIILVQDLVVREFERRYYLNSLAYPRARSQFLIGRYFAATIMVGILLILMGGVLAGTVAVVGKGYAQANPVSLGWPLVTTLALLYVDLLVILAFATFLAIVATTPAFMLIGAVGFVLIARSYGAIIELLTFSGDVVAKFANPETYRSSLSLLDYLLPDLGSLDVRMVALYGQMSMLPGDWHWRVISAVAYAAAMLALSAWLLGRREFR